jgi:hypothetical protein
MSESRAIDAQSRDSIRTDLVANILVEAGAGSGKTQMLAERMAAGVAQGVYAIDQMAAVTFTRKAASELRGRFHLALEARLVTASAADLRRLGMWLSVEQPKLRDVLDLAVDTVLQVAKAGFWTEAKAASHAVEAPFAHSAVPDRKFKVSGSTLPTPGALKRPRTIL